MSSVPTTVDVERGTPLEGLSLTREQQLELYRSGFVVLKNVVSKELTAAAKAHMAADVAGEFGANATGQNPIGSEPAILDLINASKFRPVLQSLIGDFDEPSATQVAVTPPGTDYISGKLDGQEGFNSCGYREEGFPYYNAIVHMDGLSVSDSPQHVCTGTKEQIYLDYISGDHSETQGPGGTRGRNAMNFGINGGVLFQDKECSISTGSFTLFAVVCLNDQTTPGCGQFTVLRGSHHAMEKFYQMQQSLGGIVGPEGPGWPRLDFDAPNRCGFTFLPEMVREEFVDERAEPSPDGRLWPQPTQCCMEEGDVVITMHAIPHSASRNEGVEPRANMIWRIRAKQRQPNFVHNGATDHADRLGPSGINGEWMEFEQDEPPYFPGEEGNDPFQRSKFALAHIWHEWPGMAEIVAEMKAEEQRTGAYPRGAGPTAAVDYAAKCNESNCPFPTTPKEAREFWAEQERRYQPAGAASAKM